MAWYPFDHGSSVGAMGSEGGSIVLDEEHPDGARITLEGGGAVAPWSITCGVYGSMMHTRFFSTRVEADGEFEAMKSALEQVLHRDDARWCGDFVRRFPT